MKTIFCLNCKNVNHDQFAEEGNVCKSKQKECSVRITECCEKCGKVKAKRIKKRYVLGSLLAVTSVVAAFKYFGEDEEEFKLPEYLDA